LYDMYHWDKPADTAPARRRKASQASQVSQAGPDPSAARLPAPRDGSNPTGTDQATATTEATQAPWTTEATQTPQATQATQAVQFALDRRDNGGDAVTVAGQPTARQTRQ
jgi:hypothetical protein